MITQLPVYIQFKCKKKKFYPISHFCQLNWKTAPQLLIHELSFYTANIGNAKTVHKKYNVNETFWKFKLETFVRNFISFNLIK